MAWNLKTKMNMFYVFLPREKISSTELLNVPFRLIPALLVLEAVLKIWNHSLTLVWWYFWYSSRSSLRVCRNFHQILEYIEFGCFWQCCISTQNLEINDHGSKSTWVNKRNVLSWFMEHNLLSGHADPPGSTMRVSVISGQKWPTKSLILALSRLT